MPATHPTLQPCRRGGTATRLAFTQEIAGPTPAGGTSPPAAGCITSCGNLSGVAEREGARLLTESTWVRVPPPELSPSGRVAEGGRLQSGRAIVPHGCESRLGVHVDVAQWPERCVADALMPVRSRSSTPSRWPAGEVLVVAHLASTQDERVRFPPPALHGTVAQQEERRPETPEVISSTLVGPTPPAATRSSPAEHRSDTPEAPGAAPGASTSRRGPAGHGARLIRERHLVRFQGGGRRAGMR